TDNCTGAITIKTGYPLVGTTTTTNCTSTQTKTWIYVDGCGNESDAFVQTATWTTDNIKPVVTGTATLTGTVCNQQPAFIDPTATDNCTGAITLKRGYPIVGTTTITKCTSTQTKNWIYVEDCWNESDSFVR